MNDDDKQYEDEDVSGPVTAEDTVDLKLGTNEKMTDWKNEPALGTLKADLEAAKPSHDSMVAKMKRWNNLLRVEGSARPPDAGKNRSKVQPKLVRRQAEWRYPALSEPFLSSSNMFKVDPVTFEDAPAARQNALVLNHQFRNKIDRVNFIDNLVRSIVDEGTGIVRLGWCQYTRKKKVKVPVFDHYPLDPANPEHGPALQALEQAIQLQTADPRGYFSLALELRSAVEYFAESGQPTFAVQNGTETKEEEEVYDNRPTLEVKNPSNIYVDPSCNGDMNKAMFIIESFETNRAELEKEGRYKNLDEVNWEGSTVLTEPDHETATPTDFNFKDKARKKVVAHEYWGYYDVEGDGELTAFVCTWIGDVVIRLEENPYPDKKLPYVIIPYSPIKRELFGEPDAEVLGDNQAILGAITRGMIDSMARSANGQKGYAKGMMDAANRRKYEAGEDYEFNPNMPTNQGVIEHKYPEIPQSAMLMLQLQNQEAESLTGVKAFSGGMSGNAYGDVVAGIKGMLDAAAKREMAILRRVAKGVSEIGKKILMMNGVFLGDTEVVRITNEKFVTVNRDDLRGQFDCIVDISTYEVDNAKAQDLGFMLQTLGPNMDPQISMEILAQIAELKRMPELAHKLRNWQPKPDPVQQQLQELAVQKAQMEVAELQAKVGLLQAQSQAAMATAGLKNLDKLEQETGVKHQRELDQMGEQGRANRKLEIIKALTKVLKNGESLPDVLAAIGYDEMANQSERASARSE